MTRSYRLARAPDTRRPMSSAVVLLVLLAQVTACQPDPTPAQGGTSPDQPTGTPSAQTSPDQPPNTPSTQTSPDQPPNTPSTQPPPFSLTSVPLEPGSGPELPSGSSAFLGVLTTDSALGYLDFRYDAYVVTARESGSVTIRSDVLEANPDGYRYGYGYPLSIAYIQDGVTLTQNGGNYVQNALETGTAIIDYPVQAGQQYILVYKTFGKFTPLKYRLTLPSTLTVEGRIVPVHG